MQASTAVSKDTISLLKECNSGIKMGVDSIDDVIDSVNSDKLKSILNYSKDRHSELGNRTHVLLNKYGCDEKDPHPVAKVMSHTKTAFKLTANPSDSTIADLMTEGSNMGIKSLNKYLNQYSNADDDVVNLTHELIAIEQELVKELEAYL